MVGNFYSRTIRKKNWGNSNFTFCSVRLSLDVAYFSTGSKGVLVLVFWTAGKFKHSVVTSFRNFRNTAMCFHYRNVRILKKIASYEFRRCSLHKNEKSIKVLTPPPSARNCPIFSLFLSMMLFLRCPCLFLLFWS